LAEGIPFALFQKRERLFSIEASKLGVLLRIFDTGTDAAIEMCFISKCIRYCDVFSIQLYSAALGLSQPEEQFLIDWPSLNALLELPDLFLTGWRRAFQAARRAPRCLSLHRVEAEGCQR
jgi:hypothetical protein